MNLLTRCNRKTCLSTKVKAMEKEIRIAEFIKVIRHLPADPIIENPRVWQTKSHRFLSDSNSEKHKAVAQFCPQ